MTIPKGRTIDYYVINIREWPDHEQLGIPRFIGEKFPDFNSVLFNEYYPLKGCTYKKQQVYCAFKPENTHTEHE